MLRFALLCVGAAALALAGPLAPVTASAEDAAQVVSQDTLPIKSRNVDVSRAAAASETPPRSEGDQAIAGGWPLYRTERGQEAFNAAMATLQATDEPAPPATVFEGCAGLDCNLSLPAIGEDGWIPQGRVWVSPTDYVLIVHSPRLHEGQTYRRRSLREMKYFVFHEFQNSTQNTDPYDTISAHSGSVYVPLYMSREGTDAKGRHFVIVVQVAPYDVVSYHATNWGSAGPGMEVAKNSSDPLEPLQGLAGILIATIVKSAAPHLQVVNHRGVEGLPMLNAYKARLATLREHPGAPMVALPFVPAPAGRIATATAALGDLIVRPGISPTIPVAKRGFMPPKEEIAASAPVRAASLMSDPVPVLIGPIRPAVRPTPPTLVQPLQPAIRPALLPDAAR